jgi:hypothetical protein
VDEWIVGVTVALGGWRLIGRGLPVVGWLRGCRGLVVALGWPLVDAGLVIVVDGWFWGCPDQPPFAVAALGAVKVQV